jgi:branched-chain amino acid transport system permease protein
MSSHHRMLPSTALHWLGLAAAVALLAALPLFATSFYVGLATTALIGALLALSLHLLVGGIGLVSLGHGAFYGLAAYTVYLVSPEGAAKPIWTTLPLAMIVSGVAAFLIGVLSLRTRGFFFLMVTLAFGQMIYFVFHDTKLGGGTDGAYLAKPLISALGYALDPTSLPRGQRGLPAYYVALVQLVLTYFGLTWLMRSLYGRVLEGIRVNEHRMEALGFNTTAYKLVAFTIAGALAGAAGHMWAMHSGFVNPELVSWHKSAEALLMILLGGIGSLSGAVVGAFAFVALGEVADLVTEHKLLFEGVAILLAVLVLRNGIMGFVARGAGAAAPAAVDQPADKAAQDRPESAREGAHHG